MPRSRPLRPVVLALALAGPLAMSTLPAHAQQRTVVRAPVVNALQLNADAALDPGSQLQFRVEGTPGARGSVRINDSNVVVPLRETSAGVYRGTYTVRRTDRIDPTGVLRASLSAGNLVTTNNFTFPPAFVALARPPAPAQPQPAPARQAVAEAPRIDRFEVRSPRALEPGTQLTLELQGAAGGQASANVPGVVRDVPLREVRPGLYRGQYTVRTQDNLLSFASAAATLRLAGQAVSSNLTQPLDTAQATASAPAPTQVLGAAPDTATVRLTSHANNALIDGVPTQVRGQAAPHATVRVRVDAIAPSIGQRAGVARQLVAETVQADSQGVFSFAFDPRGSAPGTRYEVNASTEQGGASAQSRLVLLQRG